MIELVAPSRAPCPSCVSAFKKAARAFAENPSGNAIVLKPGISFDSLGEAYDFCNMYS